MPEKFASKLGHRAPCYSFSGRRDLPVVSRSPGPNAYSLPSLMGSKSAVKPSSASATISSRLSKGAYWTDFQRVSDTTLLLGTTCKRKRAPGRIGLQ